LDCISFEGKLMRRFQPRFTMRGMMVMVAVAAVLMAVWAAWFDPVRQWRRAVTNDENGLRRWEALDAMAIGKGHLDAETALLTFVEALDSPSHGVRETAVEGLGRLGPQALSAAKSMIRALADPDSQVRLKAAANVLLILPDGDPARDDAVPALQRLLDERSWQVRLRAAHALVEFGRESDALPVLIDALRQPDYLTRSSALWSLGRIGPPAAPDALPVVTWLEREVQTVAAPDMSRFLRVYAAQTRYLLGDRAAALETLRARAEDPDPDLVREARRILSRLFPNGDGSEPGSFPGTP
jgi:HEAT repeat protein